MNNGQYLKCIYKCIYKCGTPSSLAFHYKMSHEDKMNKCACGVKSLSGICIKIDGPFNGV